MEQIVKNKVISMGGSSYVVTPDGEQKYKVKGKVFSITKKKWLCDLEGNKLFLIRNKYFRLFTNKALIYNNEKEKIAYVKTHMFSIKKRLTVEGYGKEIIIDNQKISLGFHYNILVDGEEIGTISRDFKIIAIRDQFNVTAHKEEDAPLLVALTIAIDNIGDNNRNQHD